MANSVTSELVATINSNTIIQTIEIENEYFKIKDKKSEIKKKMNITYPIANFSIALNATETKRRYAMKPEVFLAF